MALEVYKLDIGGLHGGSWNQISIWLQTNNTGPDPNLFVARDLVTDWNADRKTAYLALFPNTYAVEWIRARRVSTGGGKSRTIEYPGSSAQGSTGTSSGSLSLSPIVKLICGMASDTIGRIFMPCVSEAFLNENVLDPDYVNDVVTHFGDYSSWTGSLSGREWNQVVFSRKLGTYHTVVARAMSDVIGNQRKRRVPR